MLPSPIRFIIRRTPVYGAIRFVRDRLEESRWNRHPEHRGPAPHRLKVRTLREYAQRYGLKTLVETGTYYGDTIWRVRGDFSRIVSIEIDPMLAGEARRRFAGDSHVEFVIGDSGRMLPEVLARTTERCLFWLDGHYSGEITGRGDLDSPIVAELKHVWRHSVSNHVILVDDARDFTGQGGYPTIEELRAAVKRERPDWSFDVRDDIIRICPPGT